MAEVELLLRVLKTIDFRQGVSESVAQHLETMISAVLDKVESRDRLPDNDPLRFDKNGIPLSRQAIDAKLQMIIQSS